MGSFFLGDHSPGVGRKKKSQGGKQRQGNQQQVEGMVIGGKLDGHMSEQASPRERNVHSADGHILNCTGGNRQKKKNVQHSETVRLDNPKLGCLIPKGQMSAKSPQTVKHLWFLLNMSELGSLIITTLCLSQLFSALHVPR